MKRLTIIALLWMCALLIVPVDSPAELFSKQAITAAEQFALTIDAGSFAVAYSRASPLLQMAQDEADFIIDMKRARKLLGPVQQRQLTALRSVGIYPRLPDGDYLIVQFKARTRHKNKASEIILLKQQNGTWLVVDYSIR